MHKFLIDSRDIGRDTARIRGQDARHISRVLRLVPGDTVLFTDGRGRDFTSTVTAVAAGEVRLSIRKRKDPAAESHLHITVFQGMLKDRKMDLLIRHLTELGIDEWVPVFCGRSVPSPDKKRLDARGRRWEKIAVEALKQCGRSFVPETGPPVRFAEVMASVPLFDLNLVWHEKAGQSLQDLGRKTRADIKRVSILIGPEGGFSEAEIESACTAGFESCLLGPRVLRSETASIAACSIVQHFFGDMT